MASFLPILLHDQRPFACHLDAVGEKFHGSVACDIHVSIFAFSSIKTTKRKRLSGNGNTNIHSEHTSAELRQKPVSISSIGGVNGSSISKRIPIFNPNRFFPARSFVNRQNWTKNFLFHRFVTGGTVENDGRSDPVTTFLFPRTSIQKDLGTTLLRVIDIRYNFVVGCLIDDWSQFAWPVASFDLLCIFNDSIHQRFLLSDGHQD
mmetsp:Transcript_4573/g.12971  ORF Transcript_4573/g.12971 Transcript_4573/m.12971 type:complete len:205 (+) Transcript_4573:130-744(+)